MNKEPFIELTPARILDHLPEMTREGIRDRVFVKLVGSGLNAKCLRDPVRLPVEGGFSLTVCISMNNFSQHAMIQISRGMAAQMGYNERELIEDAMRNTVSAHPARLIEMQKVMMDLTGLRKLAPEDNLLLGRPAPIEDTAILVLSNADLYYGSAALFYPGIKQQIAGITGGSFYVLPSSVHELLILPGNSIQDEQALAAMVRSVNSAEVAPEEQLGNKLLYYNAALERLMIAVDLDGEKAEKGSVKYAQDI